MAVLSAFGLGDADHAAVIVDVSQAQVNVFADAQPGGVYQTDGGAVFGVRNAADNCTHLPFREHHRQALLVAGPQLLGGHTTPEHGFQIELDGIYRQVLEACAAVVFGNVVDIAQHLGAVGIGLLAELEKPADMQQIGFDRVGTVAAALQMPPAFCQGILAGW
ncbi:hypothetical protein Spiaf_2274 [Spirochaeta africana DSM 8902]|uniref:Uncharacterized protein n=1 Tax=Spirochaeta africana (strain ATCC 700263 / DSM 8902 / Z-7692) TaxID=889378 RepID=H9ULB6_SPIAZ|nr:hypothetical protein [Spirochaeta africana]AFG38309.1 hypothetical protein Spiaf_2274 [Spirochaeta africana DSM 8902]